MIAAKEIGVIELAQAQSVYNVPSNRALGCFHDSGVAGGCVDKRISVDEYGRVIVVVSK